MPVKFVLFDLWPELVDAWREAFQAFVPQECLEHITFVNAPLDKLNVPFDTIVSPANSFGRFDGSFDQVLSDTLAPPNDNKALTRTAQTLLYKRWRGFAPPGTCTLIPLAGTPCADNPLHCRYVALCPTMRYPAAVTWHREVVYNCVWSLLVAIDEHNDRVKARNCSESEVGKAPGEKGDEQREHAIEAVVMTGLATGVGAVPAKLCAKQMALAFAHYHEAKTNPEKWAHLNWRQIADLDLDRDLPRQD